MVALVLVSLKETDTQCCPRLWLLLLTKVVGEETYRTFGLRITG